MFKSTDRSVRQYIERQQRTAKLEQEQAEKDKKERRKAGLLFLGTIVVLVAVVAIYVVPQGLDAMWQENYEKPAQEAAHR
ncbi:hypothetical protein [Bacillus phage SPO1L1]|nr:hypothetical protein [Bacillus phage SPO1L1]WIT26156.1 hypothetical protein [Bacillus phage SPO1L2]